MNEDIFNFYENLEDGRVFNFSIPKGSQLINLKSDITIKEKDGTKYKEGLVTIKFTTDAGVVTQEILITEEV